MPVFFCAGEPSGDLYAGLYIKQLKKEFPGAVVWGVGNGCMMESGVSPVFQYRTPMTFGLTSGLLSLLQNLAFYRQVGRQLYRLRPRTFVAVAYPGVNLLLCRVAKRMGMRVYYFLPPQIWAWGMFRKYMIEKWVDAVISVFPFEACFYRNLRVKTTLVDNPLARKMQGFKRTDSRRRICFMPGSRGSQIKRNMPVVLDLMCRIRKQEADTDLCILAYDREQAAWLSSAFNGVQVVHENRYQVMKNCDLLIICSGTASLEAAFLGVPQIFFNRPSFLDFQLLRRFVGTNEYNLTNILYGRKIVPAFIDYRPGILAEHVHKEIRLRWR